MAQHHHAVPEEALTSWQLPPSPPRRSPPPPQQFKDYLPMATQKHMRDYLKSKYLLPLPPTPRPPSPSPLPDRRTWVPPQPHDSFLRPIAKDPDWPANAFRNKVGKLPPSTTRAALIYLNLGPWPPWSDFLLLSAAFNTKVTFYFVGSLLDTRSCANCVWLPLNAAGLARQATTNLGVPSKYEAKIATLTKEYRKLCDMKPLWPALLAELSARHEWIGYADTDVLLGDLNAEITRLHADDELLVPMEFFPHPLANGNLLLMRSASKLLYAFNRSNTWHQVLRDPLYDQYDEFGFEPPSIAAIFQGMLLGGELIARPTLRIIAQDAVVMRGRSYPTIGHYGANTSFTWSRGTMIGERRGVCICPNDVISHSVGLTVCHQCLMMPGHVLRSVITHRRLEVLGVHLQEWKKYWRITESKIMYANEGRRPQEVKDPAPNCVDLGTTSGFFIGPGGFTCGERPRLWEWLQG